MSKTVPPDGPILVTGGAGYIGSHVALELIDAGRAVIVLDDLSTGRRAAAPGQAVFIRGDAGDRNLVRDILIRHGVSGVLHFAGSIIAPESVEKPLEYYRNNTLTSHAVISACVDAGTPRLIFSSSAAVYGLAERQPIDESAPTAPINPYGASKLMTEWMLRDAAAAHDLRHVALRYFNVAGADPRGRAGQTSKTATHLLKIAAEAALGKRREVLIYGDDYPTPDGTCIRDYIHVSDLAAAHVAALRYLEAGGASQILNCGYGRGYSVREALDMMGRAAGRPLPQRVVGRRPGDPPALVADAGKIRRILGWTPRYADPAIIAGTALAWERRLAETGNSEGNDDEN